MSPRGRRPGTTSTRAAIVTAARAEFAASGFAGATVRAIAARAGVDPAMINHHFDGKRGLFLATLDVGVDPAENLAEIGAAGPDGLGIRLVQRMLTIWDSPAGTAATAMIRTAIAHEESAALVREFIGTQVLQPLGMIIADDRRDREQEIARRTALVATQVLGLVVARYVLALEPVASATPDGLAATIGPNLQRYLTGDLPSMDQVSAASVLLVD